MKAVASEIVFENVRKSLEENRPFVLYRKPNSDKTIGVFQQNSQTFLANDFSEKGYIFAPFSGNTIFLIPESEAEILTSEITSKDIIGKENSSIENHSNKEQHLDLVQRGINAIHSGELSKVVLSRKETLEVQDFDNESVFATLLELYPTAFAYCWYHPETGLWLGAFSELLLRMNGNTLETMSVAGTQPWHNGDIIWREKEIEEQQIVTDFIVESLKPFASDIQLSKPYTLKAGQICHIKTDISADLKSDVNLSEIIKILHPTPAVCGMPKAKAMDFIRQNEKYDREFYSGFHGELNRDSQTEFFVNLRCVKVVNKTASLFIGGGITKDSNPEHEWTETVNKAQTMKKVLI